MIALELVIRPTATTLALWMLRNGISGQSLSHSQCIEFISLFCNQPLVMRHIFRNQPELCRALLLVTLDIAVTHIDGGQCTVFDSGAIHLEWARNEEQMPFFDITVAIYGLAATMRYWRRDHFLFAVDNGFIDLLVVLWKRQNVKFLFDRLLNWMVFIHCFISWID